MTHKIIKTENAPKPANYSQGRLVDLGSYSVLYTCGQTGDDVNSGEVVGDGISEQTKQALENIKGIVEECGGALDDIVKVNVSIKNMFKNKAGFERVYISYFPEDKPRPARAMVEVNEIPLPTDPAIVEIEAIAYIKK